MKLGSICVAVTCPPLVPLEMAIDFGLLSYIGIKIELYLKHIDDFSHITFRKLENTFNTFITNIKTEEIKD